MREKAETNRKRAGIVLYSVLFALYPFIMTNGYYNITATKYSVFAITTLCVSFYILISRYLERVTKEKGFSPRKPMEIWNGWVGTDRWMFAFVLSVLLSFLFAKRKMVAFTGSTDSHIGLYMILLLVLLYRVVRKEVYASKIMGYLMVIAADLVVLFALVQFLGGDPFVLLTDLQTDRINNFLSTFGNTAVYGQYLTLIFPIAIYLYCVTTETTARFIYGISCFIGMMGVLISNSDAAFLGFGVAMAIIAMLMTKKRGTLLRLLEVVAIEVLAAAAFGGLYRVFDDARAISRFGMIAMNGNDQLLLLIGALVVWLICFFLIKSEQIYKVLSYLVLAIFLLAVGAVVGAFFYFSVVNRSVKLGSLDHYLRFSKEWGTERGYVWTWLWNIFLEAPFYQKLFGAGQGSVVLELFTHYADEMISGLGYYFDNAHNVYLHYLTTIGILGVISYLGVFTSAVKAGLQKKSSGLQKAMLIALIAYGIQDIFCILQPITLPFVFFYFAILASDAN